MLNNCNIPRESFIAVIKIGIRQRLEKAHTLDYGPVSSVLRTHTLMCCDELGVPSGHGGRIQEVLTRVVDLHPYW